ncbi:hypothetical protein [Streptomyces sp. NPDC001123]
MGPPTVRSASLEFGEAVDHLRETTEAPRPQPYVSSAKPLHTLTAEEWREEGKAYWESRQPAPFRPVTIGELTAGRSDADEASERRCGSFGTS